MGEKIWKDTTEVYRVVSISEHKEKGDVRADFYGPYAVIGTARARRTHLQREADRWRTLYKYEWYVQQLENDTWVTVPDKKKK